MRLGLQPLGAAAAEHAGSCVAAALLSAATLVGPPPALAAPEVKSYDGFAEYAAQGRKMDDTDVNCLIGEQQCKAQTLACFSGQEKLGGTGDLSCLKGVVCLGRCQGEQRCATQCFAQYGSGVLDNWLSCAIEEEQCVKVPQDLDFSQINANPPPTLAGFKAAQLAKGPPAVAGREAGSWYKVLGLNPKYDLYDCQINTFRPAGEEAMDIDIEFRVPKPKGGGGWPNAFTEHLVIDPPGNALRRSFHTEGKMFGLTFNENWYILGGRDATESEPAFWVAAYKGHTLQGNYEGAFVFAKEPTFPESARPALAAALRGTGFKEADFKPIDNACPAVDESRRVGGGAGWDDLLALVEWVRPGTIFEYDK